MKSDDVYSAYTLLKLYNENFSKWSQWHKSETVYIQTNVSSQLSCDKELSVKLADIIAAYFWERACANLTAMEALGLDCSAHRSEMDRLQVGEDDR